MKKLGKLYLVLVMLFLYAPIFVLIVFSFNESKSSSVFTGFTLDWYKRLFNNRLIINPEIVTGVSLMLLFSFFAARMTLEFGFVTLLIAHITFDVPYVILNVMPKFNQMDPHLYEAAQDLGCSPFKAFRKVVLPEIMPGVISGFLMSFTYSLDDFVISYFTSGSTSQTLPITIYSMTRRKVSPEINALSTLIFITVVIVLIVKNFVENKAAKKAGTGGR